ncbi:alpha/beta hydrolase [Mycobacterium sp.]|uniref:alpha/beta fold hydrolase n=1 Tax=Mycobacterium sp. TaxID=1785 RepID=UPI002B9514C5|nr:alpha/beta hydrolase [Mycobacterium sp.]HTQ21431.1 alpha/beta hydrolase [Mycobacterium sp.]
MEKSPLVLLHGATGSGRIWQDTVPLLSAHHDVRTPTLLGHRGGPAIQRRPASVSDMVDAMERYLDEHDLGRPHFAGDSLGGWVSIELARRGRAASVCAFSPAGFWWDRDSHEKVFRQIRRMRAQARLSRPIAPLVLRSAVARRVGLRTTACHGDRLTAAQVVGLMDDSNDCPFMDDYTPDQQVEPLDPLPCPVTLAWAQFDRLVPAETYGRTARERLPGATWVLLPGVGHLPMIDDPALVARTVMAVTGVAV